jgi:hypothetical protein
VTSPVQCAPEPNPCPGTLYAPPYRDTGFALYDLVRAQSLAEAALRAYSENRIEMSDGHIVGDRWHWPQAE